MVLRVVRSAEQAYRTIENDVRAIVLQAGARGHSLCGTHLCSTWRPKMSLKLYPYVSKPGIRYEK